MGVSWSTPTDTHALLVPTSYTPYGMAFPTVPAQVEGRTEPYFILNVLHVIRCIDDARCETVQYWTPEDGEPELVGKYMNVRGLKVDPARMGDLSAQHLPSLGVDGRHHHHRARQTGHGSRACYRYSVQGSLTCARSEKTGADAH
jgi:hypothetical protein